MFMCTEGTLQSTFTLQISEGKTNKQGIRWKMAINLGSDQIRTIIEQSNPVIQHGLNSSVKYVRILWRDLNGKRKWYVQ